MYEKREQPTQVQNSCREKTEIDIALHGLIINSLPVGIITVNPQMQVTTFNPWAETLTGYTSEEALGRYCGDVLQGGMCKSDCPLRRAIDQRNPVVQVETTIQRKDSGSVPVRMNTAALLDPGGGLIGGVEAFQDISTLKAMQREKDNLIYMFAHDMKSSLTVVGGFALRLLKDVSGTGREKESKYLGIIQRETNKLDFLINDFLELARLQAGQLKLNLQATSLDKELMELIEAYQSKVSQAGISLEFQTETILPVVDADPNRLRRAFTNILDNAIKFSKKGSTIRILPDLTPQEIMIRIEDQGSGIAPEDLPYVFDAFYRSKQVREKEGAGLGLASVKSIVEAHGGKVKAESILGKGSAFTVILPRARR